MRRADLALTVDGPDGFALDGVELDLRRSAATRSTSSARRSAPNHQYPDGLVLFLGTMFAPTQDRHGPGQGFTHAVGDVVTIATPSLGALVNRVNYRRRDRAVDVRRRRADAQPGCSRLASPPVKRGSELQGPHGLISAREGSMETLTPIS